VSAPQPIESIRRGLEATQQQYGADADDERPLGGYIALAAVYGTGVAAFATVVRRKGLPVPERPSAGDVALMAVATHKLSRLLSKDAVTSPIRAPFTRFEEPTGGGEVKEQVREGPVRHAVGELLTCPFCLDVWVATAIAAGLIAAPRTTRWVTAVLSSVAAGDALQFAYDKLKDS
jgi:hypothetical protein